MKGYKVFNPDWTCRGYQYEVGKSYSHEGEIELCRSGFHYCEKLNDCFNYYKFDPGNKVAEISAEGDIVKGDDKHVTNKIKIVRELTWQECLDLVNTGKGNTGRQNSGYRNSGDWNGSNYSSGFFNPKGHEEPIYIFGKKTKLTREEVYASDWYNVLRCMRFYLTEWIPESDMTEEEKEQYPRYETAGGYLKTYSYKEAWKNAWRDEYVETVKNIPNFDAKIFEEITGIKI